MRDGRHDPTPAEWADIFRRKAISAFRVAASSASDHPNSAANRAYYAVLHGIQMRHGPMPPLPRDHGRLASTEVLARVGLEAMDGREIQKLYECRHMADYAPKDVFPGTAHLCVERAARLLSHLGVEVGFTP